jgi:hypothetical protein
MKYVEMKEAITAGTMAVGDDVWVVDHRYKDIKKAPVRNITPTHVRIFETGEEVYGVADPYRYSGVLDAGGYHFRSFGKNGKLLVKLIAPHDVDYPYSRQSTEHSVHVFLTEAEAQEKYREQVEVAMGQLREQQDQANIVFNLILLQLQERLR